MTPRRVNASGITSGAASCTVTTSGTRPVGGTAGDGACTRSTGATRRTGPATPSTCQASYSTAAGSGRITGVDVVEVVRVQRPVDVGAGMAGGERGHVDAEARE